MFKGHWIINQINHLLKYLESKSPSYFRNYWKQLEPSSVKKRFLHGAFWNSIGAFLARVLAMVTSIIIARFLGKEGFGEYGMIFSTLGMFGPLAGLQQSSSASVFVAQNREKDKKKAGKIIKLTLVITLVMGFVTGLIIFFSAPYLSKNLLNNGQLITALRWASLLIVFNAFNSAFYGILTGFEAFKRLAFITLLSSFISLPLVIAGVFWEGLPGLIAGMIVAQIILTVIYYEDLRGRTKGGQININEPHYGSELRLVLAFSLPTMVASMVSGPATWASNAILVNQPGGYGEMGIFQAAQQWKVAVMLIPSLINNSALPVMSNSRFNQKEFAQAVKYNIGACAGLSFLTAIGIILFSKFIMGFYGQAFKTGSMVLIITVLMAVLQSISQALTQVMISTNRVWANMAVNIGWALVMVVLAFFWVPKGLAVGLVSASLVSWFVIVLWQSTMVVKIINEKKESANDE